MQKTNRSFLKVTSHSHSVGPGSTFVALSGLKTDGALFIPQAIQQGAAVIIADQANNSARVYAEQFNTVQFRFVENPRKELAVLAAQAYGNPASKLQLIGITGTKGKTTTSFLVRHILQKAGFKTALCSSIVNAIDETYQEMSMNATMLSDSLHYFFSQCVHKKITHCIVEVSSHALALYRVYGLSFRAAAFTNCKPEHLDFHKNFDDYFSTKMQIFDQVIPEGVCVVNTLVPEGEKVVSLLKNNSQKKVRKVSSSFYQPPSSWRDAPFMKQNVDLAAAVCEELGVTPALIEEALQSFEGVPGRLQFHTLKNGALGVVDFAHEPLSFKTILSFLKQKRSQLIVIFGCGGDRTYKRPLLGAVAAQYADMLILTNDNPRFDVPEVIIGDIYAGVPSEKRKNVIVELDRARALDRAVSMSSASSCIALLGKGHEQYQIEGEQVSYWNDYEALSQY